MKYEQGLRVVAISHTEGDTLYIFGYGVYEGDFVPPFVDFDEELKDCVEAYAEARKNDPQIPEPDPAEIRRMVEEYVANPRIKLDSGKTVWGYECWWGDEATFESKKADHKNVVEIDIDDAREKSRLKAN
jgi:hypothetical protein